MACLDSVVLFFSHNCQLFIQLSSVVLFGLCLVSTLNFYIGIPILDYPNISAKIGSFGANVGNQITIFHSVPDLSEYEPNLTDEYMLFNTGILALLYILTSFVLSFKQFRNGARIKTYFYSLAVISMLINTIATIIIELGIRKRQPLYLEVPNATGLYINIVSCATGLVCLYFYFLLLVRANKRLRESVMSHRRESTNPSLLSEDE